MAYGVAGVLTAHGSARRWVRARCRVGSDDGVPGEQHEAGPEGESGRDRERAEGGEKQRARGEEDLPWSAARGSEQGRARVGEGGAVVVARGTKPKPTRTEQRTTE
jgi:hypothetical protein